jgi:hypothetical protein
VDSSKQHLPKGPPGIVPTAPPFKLMVINTPPFGLEAAEICPTKDLSPNHEFGLMMTHCPGVLSVIAGADGDCATVKEAPRKIVRRAKVEKDRILVVLRLDEVIELL